MKRLVTIILLLIALPPGCTSKQSAPPTDVSQSVKPTPTAATVQQAPASDILPVKFKELKSYQFGGVVWRSIVIPPNLEKEKLIALAHYLHQSASTTSFRIFDDDNEKEYKKFMESDIHYQDNSYPYPEAWLQKHYIAIINKMLADGGARWQLYAMDAGMKYAGDDVAIANLE